MQEILDKLAQNFKKFFDSTGAKKAVVGISGGVDSACVAAIAVHALGKENVIGVLMPHKDFSSDENLYDARDVVAKLGIESKEIEISKFCEPFLKNEKIEKNDYVIANLMSRLRMVTLYSIANFYNGLVLGTSNKTEIMIGYFTKYGDGGIDVEVIGSLWKTEIYELAKHLGFEKIASKKPTAELFVGQCDEDEIGVSYAEVDEILMKIEKDNSFVPTTNAEKRVVELFVKSEHKRKLPPVI